MFRVGHDVCGERCLQRIRDLTYVVVARVCLSVLVRLPNGATLGDVVWRVAAVGLCGRFDRGEIGGELSLCAPLGYLCTAPSLGGKTNDLVS